MHNQKAYDSIQIGACIRVLPSRYFQDGYAGLWYVVGKLGPSDLKLAKHPEDEWELLCHASRIEECNGTHP